MQSPGARSLSGKNFSRDGQGLVDGVEEGGEGVEAARSLSASHLLAVDDDAVVVGDGSVFLCVVQAKAEDHGVLVVADELHLRNDR